MAPFDKYGSQIKTNRKYLIQHMRELIQLSYSLLLCVSSMEPKIANFSDERTPLVHHIITHGHVFNWAYIFSVNLKAAMTLVKDSQATNKPKFYMYAYLFDIICSSFTFPLMKWHWNENTPPQQI